MIFRKAWGEVGGFFLVMCTHHSRGGYHTIIFHHFVCPGMDIPVIAWDVMAEPSAVSP